MTEIYMMVNGKMIWWMGMENIHIKMDHIIKEIG